MDNFFVYIKDLNLCISASNACCFSASFCLINTVTLPLSPFLCLSQGRISTYYSGTRERYFPPFTYGLGIENQLEPASLSRWSN